MERCQLSSETAGAALVILSAVIFGTMPLCASIAYDCGCNPYTAAFGRFASGAMAAAGVIVAHPALSFRVSRRELGQLAILSVLYALTPVLLYLSYQSINSGLATTLHFTYPLAVMVLGAVLFRKKLRGGQLLCLGICAAGILCFYRSGGAEGSSGILIAVLSGLSYAVYILLLGKSDLRSLPVLVSTFWISLLSAGQIGVFSLVTGKLAFPDAWQGWAALAALGVFATVMALALFQKGVFLCGEVKASLLSTFEPLTGVLLGALVLREPLTGRSIIGIALILLSTVLLVIGRQRSAASI